MTPRGDKSRYTDKQKRRAEHVAKSYRQRGVSPKEAKRRAWATENAISGGGKKKGGSGEGRSENRSPSRKGGRKAASTMTSEARSRAAKKGWRTRRKNQ